MHSIQCVNRRAVHCLSLHWRIRDGAKGILGFSSKLLLLSILALCCASCGPHMDDQPSIKPYERDMPNMPPGTVPTRGRMLTLTAQQAALSASPIAAARAHIRDGRIYYGYYCDMCHGSAGDGNGQVGQGYLPKPTDLSSARVTGMTDGQLYAAMLSGVGHDPVMMETVLPEHRWPLVLYVRTFAKKKAPPQPEYYRAAPTKPPMPTTPAVPTPAR